MQTEHLSPATGLLKVYTCHMSASAWAASRLAHLVSQAHFAASPLPLLHIVSVFAIERPASASRGWGRPKIHSQDCQVLILYTYLPLSYQSPGPCPWHSPSAHINSKPILSGCLVAYLFEVVELVVTVSSPVVIEEEWNGNRHWGRMKWEPWNSTNNAHKLANIASRNNWGLVKCFDTVWLLDVSYAQAKVHLRSFGFYCCGNCFEQLNLIFSIVVNIVFFALFRYASHAFMFCRLCNCHDFLRLFYNFYCLCFFFCVYWVWCCIVSAIYCVVLLNIYCYL